MIPDIQQLKNLLFGSPKKSKKTPSKFSKLESKPVMIRPITHIATSLYRQYIGLKCVEGSISQDYSNSQYILKMSELPHVWFVGGLKVKGVNLITAICDHPYLQNDAFILTDHKSIEIIDTSNDTISLLGVGDKLGNLHGQKGVINNIFEKSRFEVIPETIESDIWETKATHFKYVDCLMSLSSVIERGAFGQIAECSYSYEKPVDIDINAQFQPIETGYIYDKELNEYYAAIFGICHYVIIDKFAKNLQSGYVSIDYFGICNTLARKRYDLLKQWLNDGGLDVR